MDVDCRAFVESSLRGDGRKSFDFTFRNTAKKISELATTVFQESSNSVEFGIGLRRDKKQKKVSMNMRPMIERARGFDAQRVILQDLSCDPPRRISLHDIQIRAYRIHQKHGGVYGGYTLDEWLEAKHELDQEHQGKRNKKERLH